MKEKIKSFLAALRVRKMVIETGENPTDMKIQFTMVSLGGWNRMTCPMFGLSNAFEPSIASTSWKR